MASLSRQIVVPFQIGPHGGIAFTESPAQQAVQRIATIIRTRLGERVMLPEFGSSANDFVWENVDEITAAELALRISDAVRMWETGVILRSVTPLMHDPQSGSLTLDVKFSVPPQEEVFSTLIEVGGTMTETQHG